MLPVAIDVKHGLRFFLGEHGRWGPTDGFRTARRAFDAMQNPIPTSEAPRQSRSPNPSGTRRWSARHWRALELADAFDGLPEGEDRFSVVRLLDRVGHECGWNRTLIRHLSLLIEYTRPQDWTAGHNPIVWLSQRETAHRLGLSPSQAHRNEDHLFHHEAIAYRDSSNYRRFGRRNGDGHIVEAYGLDLSPVALWIPRLTVLSETIESRRGEWRRLRRLVAAARRRIDAALVSARAEDTLSAAAGELVQDELETLASRDREAMTVEPKQEIHADLERLEARLRSVVEGTEYPAPAPADAPESIHEPVDEPVDETPKTVATATEYDCQGKHKCLPPYDYNTNDSSRKETPVAEGPRKDGVVEAAAARAPQPAPAPAADPPPRAPSDTETAPHRRAPRVSYDTVLAVVPPAIAVRLPAGRRPSWPELTDAVAAAAGAMGISQHAWGAACRTLGRRGATIAGIVIAARHAEGRIASPGGYLRAMTDRGARGELRLAASVHGLLQDRKGTPAMTPTPTPPSAAAASAPEAAGHAVSGAGARSAPIDPSWRRGLFLSTSAYALLRHPDTPAATAPDTAQARRLTRQHLIAELDAGIRENRQFREEMHASRLARLRDARRHSSTINCLVHELPRHPARGGGLRTWLVAVALRFAQPELRARLPRGRPPSVRELIAAVDAAAGAGDYTSPHSALVRWNRRFGRAPAASLFVVAARENCLGWPDRPGVVDPSRRLDDDANRPLHTAFLYEDFPRHFGRKREMAVPSSRDWLRDTLRIMPPQLRRLLPPDRAPTIDDVLLAAEDAASALNVNHFLLEIACGKYSAARELILMAAERDDAIRPWIDRCLVLDRESEEEFRQRKSLPRGDPDRTVVGFRRPGGEEA